MKKYKIILSSIALGLAVSCSTDRLPDDAVTPDTYWTKEQDVRLALNGVYNFLGDEAYDAWYYDGYADNEYNQYPWESNATNAAAGDINATSNYGYNYGYIRNANNILANVDKVNMDDSVKKRYIAETRALRAMNYFKLIYLFGDVPLVTKSEIDADVAPTKEADVLKFVLTELDAAAADLPASYGGGTGNETGRITKGAALAFKARAELYYGQFAAAAADAKKVMEQGTYRLFETNATDLDYADKWEDFVTFSSSADRLAFYKGLASYQKMFWEENENNSEFILTNQFVSDLSSNYIFTLIMPDEFSGWSSITPTVELVNAYWRKDGTTFTPPSETDRAAWYNNGTVKPEYLNEFKNRDTRLYASIMFPKSPWNNLESGWVFNWPKGGNNTSKTGYNFKKLVDPKFKVNGDNGGNDQALIRYAEVLLTYAEAKNEASGPDATVYDALDQIRKRVGMPVIARTQSQASLREIIRNERRIELAAEGQRFFDIRRWNIASNVMKPIKDITNANVQTRVWEERFKKMPYPQSAVDRNPLLKPAQTAKGY